MEEETIKTTVDLSKGEIRWSGALKDSPWLFSNKARIESPLLRTFSQTLTAYVELEGKDDTIECWK